MTLKNLFVATTCLAMGAIQCVGQEPGSDGLPKLGFGQLAAFKSSTKASETQIASPAGMPYVSATISDSVAGLGGNPASSEYAISPNVSVQHSIGDDSRFESLAGFRSESGNSAAAVQPNLPVPVQFSALGRYRTVSSALESNQYPPVTPIWEVDGQLVSAVPASSFRATIQDPAGSSFEPNFHQDLLGGQFGNQIEQRLRNSSCLREYGSTTPTRSSDQSELVLVANVKTWVTPDLFWQPLYFEDAPAERYGHHAGILQPSLSASRFLLDTVLLPYKVSAHPPRERDFGLGYDRPGNCVEPRYQRPELSGRGLLGQGAAVTGLIFLF